MMCASEHYRQYHILFLDRMSFFGLFVCLFLFCFVFVCLFVFFVWYISIFHDFDTLKDFHDFSRPGNQSFKFHDFSMISMTA